MGHVWAKCEVSLQTLLTKFKVEEFYAPVPTRVKPLPMSAETHVSTLIAAVTTMFEDGMEDAPSISKIQVQMLRLEFETVERATAIFK